jgi:HlyD family secretion protein
MTSLQIKTRVYEAMIDQVQKGAEAYIRLDAKPDKILTGKIAKVAPLPDNQNWMNPTAKVYNVYVKFDQPIDGLKPNMTAQTELILARLPSVLSVPVAAVFASQEQRYCIRSSGGRCQRVPITTGRLSETRVEVLSGLREGDVVLLNPPQEMIEQDKPKDNMPQTAPAPVPDTARKEIAHP